MTQLTIVAVPDQEDYVWKISSEKIPHMTLLFLGDVPDDQIPGIFEYTQHTADMSLRRFGLSVDHRGTLGPDSADVVFFENEGWNIDLIKQARTYLLKNEAIFKAFNSTQQYPEWTPHLTLGYPTAPAHEDKRDYPGIHWVNFSRLALWVGDFEGAEIPLKSDDRMAMADSVTDFLAHHGVKGMRWGVRKQTGGRGKTATAEPTGKAAPVKTEKGGKPTVGKGGRITSAPASEKPKTHHQISDEELRQRINRINMEQQYAKLTATPAQQSKGAKAAKFVGDILLDVGKQQAKAVLLSKSTDLLVAKGHLPVPKAKKK